MHTEPLIDAKMLIIKDSLIDFVAAHVPGADLSEVDDVIVSYVQAAVEAVESAPEDYFMHVDDLVEIMEAYVQDFHKIDRDHVYIWLMDIISTLTQHKPKPLLDEAAKPDDSPRDLLRFQIPKDSSKSSSNASSRSNSTSEDEGKFPATAMQKMPTRKQIQDYEQALKASQKHAAIAATAEAYQFASLVKFLTEMFPDASHLEVKHCVTIALGDVERALATLLHRRENGLSLSAGSLPARVVRRETDNQVIKSRIIERYSYVDRESESKEHKPLAPKHAPKKMVRYRDNKIVSLKGERYTEVSKGEEEGVKKSNKKHHP